MTMNVAVIGAGIMGLSTSMKIMQDYPACQVTIFYEKCTPNTTGDVSAGFLYPYPCGRPYASGEDEHKLPGWFGETMGWLKELHRRPDSHEIGVIPVSGYITDGEVPDYASKLFPDFREIPEGTRSSFQIPQNRGFTFSTWSCDCRKYLPWLTQQIANKGGRFVRRQIETMEELKDFDLIVNCSGIGANRLTGDKEMEPDRGQVIVVRAPWIKNFCIKGTDTYILPRMNDVVLGGSHVVGSYDLREDPKETETIWEECCKMCPSLRRSEIVGVKVGLRPGRSAIRIEIEKLKVGDREVPVLHNYGHGGAGVSLHWGCAVEASSLLQKNFNQRIK